ncbi:hypothetical protein K443DRAFT_507148 [Laccaria amethystina LaAM-08-1]|uniref:Uncharacterized protein n=1 Tax=Laccaria amethystina LaAM-08-1 TaxID=1095629 RepID=A0A0C9WSR6_9AGAR|nr:hypothetical protein K443DRAFT_507148 [Laccaria amethystina LaAM-08-1]
MSHRNWVHLLSTVTQIASQIHTGISPVRIGPLGRGSLTFAPLMRNGRAYVEKTSTIGSTNNIPRFKVLFGG